MYENQQDEKFTGDWKQAANTNEMQEIRSQLIRGRWPRGCAECADNEYMNTPSMRTRAQFNPNYNHYHRTQVDRTVYADFKFGNACNLMCTTCSGHSSHGILWEWANSNPDDWNEQTNRENFAVMRWDTKWFKQIDVAANPDLLTVKFTGGEPFVNPHVRQYLLQLISEGRTDLELEFVTNGYDINDNWHTILEQFRKVTLNISVDGVESIYNVTRYPATWNNFINKFWALATLSYQTNIVTTVSSLNVLNLVDIHEYFEGYSVDFNNMVERPQWYDPRHLPDQVIRKSVARIEASGHRELRPVVRKLLTSKHDPVIIEAMKKDLQAKAKYRELSLTTHDLEVLEYI